MPWTTSANPASRPRSLVPFRHWRSRPTPIILIGASAIHDETMPRLHAGAESVTAPKEWGSEPGCGRKKGPPEGVQHVGRHPPPTMSR